MITLEKTDADRLYWSTWEIARRVGIDFTEMLKNEVRLFLLEGIRKMWPRNKKQGEERVAKDLNKLFTHVGDEFLSGVGSEHGIQNIDTFVTFKNGIVKRLIWDRIDYTGSGMYRFHQENRDERGRVKKGFRTSQNKDTWRGRYVVPTEVFQDYSARAEKRVGNAKAGFIPALNAVAPTEVVPDWISRHSGRAPGTVTHNLAATSDNPFIIIVNRAAGIRLMEPVLKATFKTRAQALSRRLRRARQGIIDDVTAGRRIRPITEVNA